MTPVDKALALMRKVTHGLNGIANDPEVAKKTIQCMLDEMCTLCDELTAVNLHITAEESKRRNKLLNEINKGDDEQLKIAKAISRDFL